MLPSCLGEAHNTRASISTPRGSLPGDGANSIGSSPVVYTVKVSSVYTTRITHSVRMLLTITTASHFDASGKRSRSSITCAEPYRNPWTLPSANNVAVFLFFVITGFASMMTSEDSVVTVAS